VTPRKNQLKQIILECFLNIHVGAFEHMTDSNNESSLHSGCAIKARPLHVALAAHLTQTAFCKTTAAH
jgi:hypothetical protein